MIGKIRESEGLQCPYPLIWGLRYDYFTLPLIHTSFSRDKEFGYTLHEINLFPIHPSINCFISSTQGFILLLLFGEKCQIMVNNFFTFKLPLLWALWIQVLTCLMRSWIPTWGKREHIPMLKCPKFRFPRGKELKFPGEKWYYYLVLFI